MVIYFDDGYRFFGLWWLFVRSFLSTPLKRSKALALSLLIFVAIIYLLTRAYTNLQGGWGFLNAFSEAAMVGAFADWFAVTAIFRHPMGLPIPHTAIVPRKKAQLGQHLGRFISQYFLTTEQVMSRVQRAQLSTRLGRWLTNDDNAKKSSLALTVGFEQWLGALRDERVSRFVKQRVVRRMRYLDTTDLIAQFFLLLTQDGRHQQVLDLVLRQLARWIQNPAVKKQVALMLSRELEQSLYLKRLSNYAGEWGTSRLVNMLAQEIDAISEDPQHPLRRRYSAILNRWIVRLQNDEKYKRELLLIQRRLLTNPVLQQYWNIIWGEMLDWVEHDLSLGVHSHVHRQIQLALQTLGQQMVDDPALQDFVEEKINDLIPRFIERFREPTARFIEARVLAWSDQEWVDTLENSIGKDLQFIRINGTLVGGLVGILIHCFNVFFV